jgi:hypothetical protein
LRVGFANPIAPSERASSPALLAVSWADGCMRVKRAPSDPHVRRPHLLASFTYLVLRKLIELALLRPRSRQFNELEIVVASPRARDPAPPSWAPGASAGGSSVSGRRKPCGVRKLGQPQNRAICSAVEFAHPTSCRWLASRSRHLTRRCSRIRRRPGQCRNEARRESGIRCCRSRGKATRRCRGRRPRYSDRPDSLFVRIHTTAAANRNPTATVAATTRPVAIAITISVTRAA